jgi:predicted acyl esterase
VGGEVVSSEMKVEYSIFTNPSSTISLLATHKFTNSPLINMHKIILLSGGILFGYFTNEINAQNNNGQIDMLEELATKQTVRVPMSDGTEIMTDVFLPITSDSLMVNFNLAGQQISLELIPKNTQLVVYPTYKDVFGNDLPNPNPYQLPMLLTRTPYDRRGIGAAGGILSLFGYAYVSQDTRGRFESQGVDIPLYSDGWSKAPYQSFNHVLDITASNDPRNGVAREDGWDAYQYLLNNLRKDYDLDRNGSPETNAPICNGTLGTAGASAFAISHFQMAATHKIDPQQPGLRGMLSAIATGEHFNCTGYHNGVFREGLVTNWLRGQLNSMQQDSVLVDNSLHNSLHTPRDYNQLTNQAVLDLNLDHLTRLDYGTGRTMAYPNSATRTQTDISRAPVNALGNGDANGQFSRYGNLDAPNYHLSGWYDIFVNGQLETFRKTRQTLTGANRNRQKIIIGPWAHQTITARKSGDVKYPENVAEILGFSADGFDANNPAGIDISKLLNSELFGFLRYALNTNGYVSLGEPVVRIPQSQRWQRVNANTQVRIPASDYDISLTQLLNFLAGQGGLPDMPVELDLGGGIRTPLNLPIPSIPSSLPIPISAPLQAPTPLDFEQLHDVRFYVIGATDTAGNTMGAGNYWFRTSQFPLDNSRISWTNLFLHQNGVADFNRPSADEGFRTFTHDPNAPVLTCGGNNMFEETPDGSRLTQGQMNYADTSVINRTMNHPGVISFQTALMTDTMAIIGYPKATLYAKSEPRGVMGGETDTDFFVRILDVYPDGREILVQEGAVNARAREYARSVYNGAENDQAVYSNLNVGQTYEFQFELLPIAYTFSPNHRMKVLISSSNYPKYQSNPNVPIANGEFFRRQPNDGRTYTYQGQNYAPRIADNSVAFSNTQASRIELPVFNGSFVSVAETPAKSENTARLMPNPTAHTSRLELAEQGDYTIRIYDNLGRLVNTQQIQSTNIAYISLENKPAGVYRVEVLNLEAQKTEVLSLIKQ